MTANWESTDFQLGDFNSFDTDQLVFRKICFPKNVIKSQIVYVMKVPFYQQAKLLLVKYCGRNALFPININQTMINDLYNELERTPKTLINLLSLFDIPQREILVLLQDAFTRFSLTNAYQNIS